MKFSTVFSVFLAALSVGVGASPIPSNEVQETPQPVTVEPAELDTDSLGKRNALVEETDVFKQFAKIHQGMKKDEYYAFTVKWIKGNAPGDKTPQKEMKEIQQKYGFDHIAVVVGKVTEKSTGRGKTLKMTRNFDATMHHLKTFEGLKTEYDHPIWKYNDKSIW